MKTVTVKESPIKDVAVQAMITAVLFIVVGYAGLHFALLSGISH